jgi:hypothetical protein
VAPVLVGIVIAVVAVVALVWWLGRRNRHADGVDSFRRQIDALSPEARRGVVEQLNKDGQQPPPGGGDG